MAIQVGQAQSVAVKRHLFSIDEYERMIEAGVFEADARIELMRGEILEMAPIGTPHEACVARLNFLLSQQLGTDAIVWVQNSVRLPDGSQPQPDIAVLKWRDDFYAGARVLPGDVLLVVEVAESSLEYDRGQKLARYAEAGISDYWIVNIAEGVVEVYAVPVQGVYTKIHQAGQEETLALPGGLEGVVKVADILGGA